MFSSCSRRCNYRTVSTDYTNWSQSYWPAKWCDTWNVEETLKLIEIVKKLPYSLANGPRRIWKEGIAGCWMLKLLCLGCTLVVQCERTVVLQSAEMWNFSAVECGKTIRGNLRNVPHLIFRKLPLDNFPHSTKYLRPSVKHLALNRELQTQVSDTSKSASLLSTAINEPYHFMTSSDRFPVPVRSVVKSI